MRKVAISFLALCAALVASWQLSSIDIPHFKSLHVERLLVSPAHAQFNGCAPGFCGSVAQLPLTGGGFAGGRGSCTFPSLSGLIGRYLASNATVSGGNVTGINDSSGAGNNLTVTGTVPYAAAGYNGHPAFNFVGTGALINTSFPFGTGNSTTFYAATNSILRFRLSPTQVCLLMPALATPMITTIRDRLLDWR